MCCLTPRLTCARWIYPRSSFITIMYQIYMMDSFKEISNFMIAIQGNGMIFMFDWQEELAEGFMEQRYELTCLCIETYKFCKRIQENAWKDLIGDDIHGVSTDFMEISTDWLVLFWLHSYHAGWEIVSCIFLRYGFNIGWRETNICGWCALINVNFAPICTFENNRLIWRHRA